MRLLSPLLKLIAVERPAELVLRGAAELVDQAQPLAQSIQAVGQLGGRLYGAWMLARILDLGAAPN